MCPLLTETCSRTETVPVTKQAHEKVMDILAKKKLKRESLHVKNYRPVLIGLQVYGAGIKKTFLRSFTMSLVSVKKGHS